MDFIALLKGGDSLTNSLNVSRAALEILSYCFSGGCWLTGLIICDKNVIALPKKNYKEYLSSLKLEDSEGKKLAGGYGMEESKSGCGYPC